MRKSLFNFAAGAALTFLALAHADEGGGGEEGESTKTFDVSYDTSSGSHTANANVSYTVNVSDNLVFSTSTGVANGYKTEDDSVARDRAFNISSDYDPPSPWRLNVGYSNAHDLYYRPPSERYDEFKTETSSNNINSALNYDFTEKLKSSLNLGVSESYQKVIITMGEVPPPSESLTHSYGGGFDYDVTKATSVNLNYNGTISSSKIEVSRMKTWPPRPPKLMLSRKKTNSVSAGISSNKDLTDTLNLNVVLNGSDAVGRDNILPANDADSYLASATGAVTWNPANYFNASNSCTVNRNNSAYRNKEQYERQFGEIPYDTIDARFDNSTEVHLTPSERSDFSVSASFSIINNTKRDAAGNLPPPDDVDDASHCIYSEENRITSNVDLALGPDISFHLTHYLTNADITYVVTPQQNRLSRTNNLDATIGYDWTDNIRADIATAMKMSSERFYYQPLSDSDDLNVNLNTTFTYSLTRESELGLTTDISKSSIYKPYSHATESARINRHFGSSVRREFGKLFRPQVSLDFNRDTEYYPGSPESNRKHRRWAIASNVQISTSDAVTFTFSYSYADEEIDVIINPDPEDWSEHKYYAASGNIAYNIFEKLTASFAASGNHHVVIKNRIRRVVEIPAETFFNVSAGLNYVF